MQSEAVVPRVAAPRSQRTPPQPLTAIDIPDALLTIATVCAVTGLSAVTIYRLAQRGELVPARRGNRCTRWRSADVRAWLATQSAAVPEPAPDVPAVRTRAQGSSPAAASKRALADATAHAGS